MSKKKIALFINSRLGIKVLKYLHSQQNALIQFIVINEENKRSQEFLKELTNTLSNLDSVYTIVEYNDLDLEKLPEFEYGVSAMFGHIIEDKLIDKAKKDFVNLHPSLLPIGRGANPISWSVIDNKPQGVTIHKLTSKLDAGDIYVQAQVDFRIEANAAAIYVKLTESLLGLFVNFFQDWISGNLIASKQPELGVSSHRISDLESVRKIDAKEILTAEQFVRRIQALDFSNGTSAVFQDATGIEWSIRLSLEAKNKTWGVPD
ncbi:methionyl-tRNA formyltransferase [Candidatus Nanopelagicus limnes]|jgi:methionyl-tRNA formyltransferase|uniref:Methionyl-tRNA formyltransferase n=1 Tax=Candidatus Nanopelagicus limnae TaxID=1884634 RepID=A0A249JZD0_9ACTN|nr:formyltransferase family protein [Candidatus Nanopelagicus limnes]ASY09908.1 methionyl-tRNA formyltransferase [Candidatus Nanopelagicus limnes]